jgi:hypothetical protein
MKVKGQPRTGHEGPEGKQLYSSTLYLTSVLDGGGKTRYPLYRRLVGPQGRSGGVRNISPLSGLDPRTVQPVAKTLHTKAFNILYVYNKIRYFSVWPRHYIWKQRKKPGWNFATNSRLTIGSPCERMPKTYNTPNQGVNKFSGQRKTTSEF